MASPSRLPSRRPTGSSRSRPLSMIEASMLNLKMPTEHSETTAKSAKRRSLLPQFARKAPNEEQAGIKEEDERDDDRGSTHGSAAEEPRDVLQDTAKKAMPPPPRTTRPMSMYGAGGFGKRYALKPPTQMLPEEDETLSARADSLAALEGSAPAIPLDTGLKRATSTRHQPSNAPKALSHVTSGGSKHAHSRNSSTSTSTGEKRSSVISGRPTSINDPESVTGSKQPGSPKASQTSRPFAKAQILPPPKPAFNTYQQHYSPAKSALPKPPVPLTRNAKPLPIAPEEDAVETDNDVFKQQIELLQLSILHQAGLITLRDFRASAQRKLGRKHARLKKEYDGVRVIEMQQQKLTNLAALETWCPDPGLLIDCLQVLGNIHNELTALCEPGSRYAELVSTFERWSLIVQESSEGARTDFVEALPETWRAAHTSLSLKLRSLQHDMSVLPRAPLSKNGGASSLEITLRDCAILLDGMLTELEVMSKLERELLSQEKARIDAEVKAVVFDGTMIDSAKAVWIPPWQSAA